MSFCFSLLSLSHHNVQALTLTGNIPGMNHTVSKKKVCKVMNETKRSYPGTFVCYLFTFKSNIHIILLIYITLYNQVDHHVIKRISIYSSWKYARHSTNTKKKPGTPPSAVGPSASRPLSPVDLPTLIFSMCRTSVRYWMG